MANKLPILVGKVRIRSTDNQGKFYDIECATNIEDKYSNADTKSIVCGDGDTTTITKSKGTISFKVLKTKNPDLLAKLFGLQIINIASGSQTITDEKNKFDNDGVIELTYISNDGNGVSISAVKSEDGSTTYTDGTDYIVEVVDNRTYIKVVSGGALNNGDVVLVSGTYNTNAGKIVKLPTTQRAVPNFSLEIIAVDTENNNAISRKYYPSVYMTSEFLQEFKDVFRDGDINGADLTFETNEGPEIEYLEQNI